MKEKPCLLRYDWSRRIDAESGRRKGLGRSENKRPANLEIISDPIIEERSFLTLADGAKYSLSSRGKCRLLLACHSRIRSASDQSALPHRVLEGVSSSLQYSNSVTQQPTREQMSQLGGQSEARPPVFKSPSKFGTPLSTHCRRDERPSRPCPARG
ncbi:hypothetical protein TNCV_3419381 [Trichonephila clavipes]|nr:hypothetical protein TNCV_3419381 [Trichonephila clavipes]